jgi:hypothetical protein
VPRPPLEGGRRACHAAPAPCLEFFCRSVLCGPAIRAGLRRKILFSQKKRKKEQRQPAALHLIRIRALEALSALGAYRAGTRHGPFPRRSLTSNCLARRCRSREGSPVLAPCTAACRVRGAWRWMDGWRRPRPRGHEAGVARGGARTGGGGRALAINGWRREVGARLPPRGRARADIVTASRGRWRFRPKLRNLSGIKVKCSRA